MSILDLLFKDTDLSDIPALDASIVHIWALDSIRDPILLELCKSMLTDEELSRSTYFQFEQKRQSYLLSQGGLRVLLSHYLSIPAKEIKLGRSRKGKPFVLETPRIYFNISNSANLVLIAFTLEGELGVDIEKIRPLPDLDDLIASNFFEEERMYICSDKNQKSGRFFRLWTVKESYLKAIGEGMRLPPHLLKLDIQADKIKGITVDGFYDPIDWKFYEFIPDSKYVGTLTCSSDVKLIESFTFRG